MVVHLYADSNLDLYCACFASKVVGEHILKRLCNEEEEELKTFMQTHEHRRILCPIYSFFHERLSTRAFQKP